MPDVDLLTAGGPATLYAALRRGGHVTVGSPRGTVLVRPDGYVAAVAGVDEAGSWKTQVPAAFVAPAMTPTSGSSLPRA